MNAPERAPKVGEQLFGVRLTTFNIKQHQIFKISYFHKFHLSFEENYISPNIPKNKKKFYKSQKHTCMICDMSKGIFDCLKRERDVCVKTIIPSQNTALGCTPDLKEKTDGVWTG